MSLTKDEVNGTKFKSEFQQYSRNELKTKHKNVDRKNELSFCSRTPARTYFNSYDFAQFRFFKFMC